MTEGDTLMVRIPEAIRVDVVQWAPAFEQLQLVIQWHVDAATHLYWEDKDHLSPFGRIIAWNHFDIAHSLSSASVQLHCGFLADALTVLRPAVEHMIDIQYFKRRPSELNRYESKLDELKVWLSETQHGFTPRDPKWSLRFQSAGKMCEYIEADYPTDHEQRLAYQWRLLSNIADHASPERHLINLKLPEFWINAIQQTDLTALMACHQIYNLVPEVRNMIEANDSLFSRFRTLRRDPMDLRAFAVGIADYQQQP